MKLKRMNLSDRASIVAMITLDKSLLTLIMLRFTLSVTNGWQDLDLDWNGNFLVSSSLYKYIYVGNIFFLIVWTTTSGCGGRLTHNFGTIQSPNYPKAYPPSIKCQWQIEVDFGYSIEIKFQEMDIEKDLCEYDYIQVSRYLNIHKILIQLFKYTYFRYIMDRIIPLP